MMDLLSDELLLTIVKYIPLKDQFLSIQHINKAFCRVVWDQFRGDIILDEEYWVKNEHLKSLLSNKKSLSRISLRNCYWLHCPVIKAIKGCSSLTTLNLMGCTVTGKTLLHILSGTNLLDDLSFTASYDVILQIGIEFLDKPNISFKCSLTKLHIQFDRLYNSSDHKRIGPAVKAFTTDFIEKQLFKDHNSVHTLFLEWAYCETLSLGMLMSQLWPLVGKAQNFYLNNTSIAPKVTCNSLEKVGLHPRISEESHRRQYHCYRGIGLVTDGYPSRLNPLPQCLEPKTSYTGLRYLYIQYYYFDSASSLTCCDGTCTFSQLPSLEYLSIMRTCDNLECLSFSKPTMYHLVWHTDFPKLKSLNFATCFYERWRGNTALFSEIRPHGIRWTENLCRFSHIVELNLCGVEIEGSSFFEWLHSGHFPKALRSLALSVHSICGMSDACALLSDETPRKRIKIEREAGCGFLHYLHKQCPLLEELELFGWRPSVIENEYFMKWNFCFYKNWVNVAGYHLDELALFKNLRKLSLVHFPQVIDFSFLNLIGKNCKRLQCLRIANLGLPSNPNYIVQLQNLIRKLPELTELSIWHRHMSASHELLVALSECSKLKRFSLKTATGQIQLKSYNALMSVVLNCKDLYQMVVVVSHVSNTKVKQFERLLKTERLKRPALQVYVKDYADLFRNPTSLPSHVKDLSYLETRVAVHSPTQFTFSHN